MVDPAHADRLHCGAGMDRERERMGAFDRAISSPAPPFLRGGLGRG